ncbi:methionyl-tRNA formyltransferase [Collinsella intestinalis]|uniref:Methionyl-tRNA formyltransferase n=1 Tax=Collinsella intestinalis TaxID=147207 RepID=A0A414FZC3_9ACTN|nr:methionyl-tRNA formyltransferase [Collinsella intestinalis]RHD57282.1 methionyl-tRNA formyltransferase [Collinsella intestinalis]
MRVVFMGTPAFAVSSLRKLAAAHEIALVLTRPDAVRSRGKKLEPSPVKEAALELDLPVMEANRMTPEVLDALRAAEAEIFCVAAYGCILPDEVLTMAPLGCVNVHASLLPRWRGAAPIQRSILEGDAETGVSIMRIGHGVDTGAYCAQASCPVPGKSADELTAELAELGGDLLVSTLSAIADGSAVWTEQDESLVTHAAKIAKAELRLDPAAGALENIRRVMASSNAAPARCVIAGKPARVMRAAAVDAASPSAVAGSFTVKGGRVYMGCADGSLELISIKPDGKREMDAKSWAAGQREDDGAWGCLE